MSSPPFTMGIEEEYLLVDPENCALVPAPEAMMAACAARLEDQVSPEFKACQVEIGTRVCASVDEAREDLKRLRSTVSEVAEEHGLAVIAASCHPFGDWKEEHHTDKDRYNDLEVALAGVARRLLISGMHVHIGIDDPDLRVDLMNQLAYFLPHLLALSTSSPYWQGVDTGLACYRLTVFDNLPRTGLPPRFSGWGEYERTVQVLCDLEVIEDATKIWWDLRPSDRYPTVESRICDVSPRIEDTLTIAALIQSLTRMLWRLSKKNQRWRIYDRFLVSENRWRAQRFGVAEGLIDFGRREIVPMPVLIDELLELIEEDAGVLMATASVERARDIAANGTSADRQRRTYAEARKGGAEHHEALCAVVRHLIDEFKADL
ncbi:MAG: carboxylate-amine ligase [Silicimonas sp.]|nr:carboxylate-amine ligase [Silicimonas sp.]RZW09474.1 MAG: carboxylate-amine ligase [Paracoccaceae bacterium]MBT8425492.1 carboxylate-amine ligase [Silicimonas sp.]NND19627.1 carboxylate-amine ligase [Silicimonas sp.]NND22479.1 carboxylate-amine ligase [Silicimonas sp.]